MTDLDRLAPGLDPRVRLVGKVGGGREIRVRQDDLEMMGPDRFESILLAYGILREDVGQPVLSRTAPRMWTIPLTSRKEE